MCTNGENEAAAIGDFEKQRNQFKRSPNWSDIEIETLCNFVREHKQQLFMQSGAQKKANANKAKHWELAAKEINSVAGTQRHWRQVRKKWKDLVYYAKSCNRKVNNSIENQGNDMTDKNKEIPADELTVPIANIELINNSNVMTSNSSDSVYSTTTTSETSPITTPISSDVSIKEEPDVYITKETKSSLNKSPLASNSSSYSGSSVKKMLQPHRIRRRSIRENKEQFPGGISPVQNRYRLTTKRQKFSDICKLRNKETSDSMSAYQRARLQIEEEKLEVQRSTLNYLRCVCHGMQRVTTAISMLKRKRSSSKKAPLLKRRKYFREWDLETDSNDTSENEFF